MTIDQYLRIDKEVVAMLFSSMIFLWVFLPIVIIGNFILSIVKFKNKETGIKAKNIFLLISSLIFYAWGELNYLFIMLASILINYVGGRVIGVAEKYRKCKLTLIIILNLGILFVFKYFNMVVIIIESILSFEGNFIELLQNMLSMSGTGELGLPYIVLPIGISFYTFQAMSYVIDAYKSPDYIQKNIFKVALYITFFPQLVAGPIVKYSDFAHQIDNRKHTPQMTAEGIKRFITGLSKKLLIANTMAYAADYVYSLDTSELSIPLAWLGALSYLFQIYFDFSGYSDMAIGLGAMFGFTFKENFNYPYISQNMQEFWRRWHISVSTWFKEYLYIPLGGNRKGKVRTAINKLIVFFCTGLWHGASLNFIVWGLLNGVFLMIESYGIINTKKWFRPLGHIYALLVTILAFVFFRADNLTIACQYIGHMFKPSGGAMQWMMFIEQLTPLYLVV